MSKKVIELIRVSTEGQALADRAGIPAQREINRRTAQIYGLEIVRTIEIVDVSGASVLRSPEMQELLRLMESPEIHAVLTKEFSRLMRPENFLDYALLQHFVESGTLLYLPDGPIDLASKSGRLLGTIRAALAGLERREIVERMQDAKEALRRGGKNPCGSATLPYGVGYSKERGWHYTGEVEKVKQAFSLFLSGQTSYTDIGRLLNLPRTNVRFILENPIYTGWKVWDEKRDPSAAGYIARPDGRQGQRRKIKRAPQEVIRVRVLDGIISQEDFAEVQRKIELKRQKHWRARTEAPNRYTYNGFLICGNCGSLIYTHSSKEDWYVCKSHHPRERRKRALAGLEPCSNRHMLRRKLEPKLDHLLGEQLCKEEFLCRVLGEYKERVLNRPAVAAVDESVVEAKLDSHRLKRQRVLDAFFDGIIDKSERDRRIEEIDREISAYQRLLSETGARSSEPRLPDVDMILGVLEPLTEWQFLGREDRRALLAAICPEISVDRYAIKGLALNLATVGGDGHEASRPRTAR